MEWWESFFDEDFARIGLASIDPARTRKEVDMLIDALDLKKGSRVLDLACGIGRHSLELARRGYKHVVGLDFSEDAIARAIVRAKEEGLPVTFVRGDMRDPPFEGEMDAVLSVFTSFGYFDDPRDDERVVGGVARALKDGGRFLIELSNRDYVVRHFEPRGWSDYGGEYILEERKLDLETSTISGTWTFITKRGPVKRAMRIRLYSLHEVMAMLERHGLAVESTWGSLERRPLTFDHSRQTVLAVKV